MKMRSIFSCIALIVLVQTFTMGLSAETLFLEVEEKKHGPAKVPVELIFPDKPLNVPTPLVMLQHGSTRDAGQVFNSIVETDEHQKRLARHALERGFAVAIVDAFHKKGLAGNQKTQFPDAHIYARQIATHLAEDVRLDNSNFFFSGFSYGGHAALMLLGDLSFGQNKVWSGIVSAEPPCNIFHEARKFETPLLTIKGAESHYEPLPCQTMTNLYIRAGADAEIIVLPKANHYFSHNGKITKGLAINGCGSNPVIVKIAGGVSFLDGSPANGKIIREKCFTKKAGSGKSREALDKAVTLSVDFFEKHLKN
jgi:dienelactone hydrolase